MSSARFQSTRSASMRADCRAGSTRRGAPPAGCWPLRIAWMSPVKWRFRSSIGTTWVSPPPAAPPLMPNTGPSDGSRRQSSGSLPIFPRPCVSEGSFVKPDVLMPPTRRLPTRLVRCDVTINENGCGLLQLAHSFPPEILYANYWYRSATNKTMRDHLAGIAQSALAITDKANPTVLDIGCNDGTLLSNYPAGSTQIWRRPLRHRQRDRRRRHRGQHRVPLGAGPGRSACWRHRHRDLDCDVLRSRGSGRLCPQYSATARRRTASGSSRCPICR